MAYGSKIEQRSEAMEEGDRAGRWRRGRDRLAATAAMRRGIPVVGAGRIPFSGYSHLRIFPAKPVEPFAFLVLGPILAAALHIIIPRSDSRGCEGRHPDKVTSRQDCHLKVGTRAARGPCVPGFPIVPSSSCPNTRHSSESLAFCAASRKGAGLLYKIAYSLPARNLLRNPCATSECVSARLAFGVVISNFGPDAPNAN
jgi:hypothetical protein